MPLARRKFSAAVDPPDPNVGVEDDHLAASQSSSATGATGCSYFNTEPLRDCFVTGAADETNRNASVTDGRDGSPSSPSRPQVVVSGTVASARHPCLSSARRH